MKNIEDWYKQWNNNSKGIIDSMQLESKRKLEKVSLEVLKKQEEYLNPRYKKYAKNETKSIVDISYIYDKVVDGVSMNPLLKKRPMTLNSDVVYEYGFNEKDECLYRKIRNENIDQFDRLYLYLEDRIYELEVSHIYNTDMSEMTMRILGEYYFDKYKRPLKINRHYGVLNNEEYNWLDKNIATIHCGVKKYILMKDNMGVYAVFQIVEKDNCERLFSYKTQNDVALNYHQTNLEGRLSFDGINIKCSYVKDVKGKDTEYMILNIYGKKYLVSKEYIRVTKGFSYKKAKEIYKIEILEFIRKQMQIIDIQINFVNIQYFNCGYSIMDILIGFDEKHCEDVSSMKIVKDVYFSNKNIKFITELNAYINDRMYYNSFRKMMESLKKNIEQEYDINVLLIEIND